MSAKVVNHINSTVKSNTHPYLNNGWQPNYDEYDATDMDVIGEIPIENPKELLTIV